MTKYCTNGQNATIEWKFDNLPAQKFIAKRCPIDVSFYSIPDESIAGKSATNLVASWLDIDTNYAQYIFNSNDNNWVYFVNQVAAKRMGRLDINGQTIATNLDKDFMTSYNLASPLWLPSGSIIEIYGNGGNRLVVLNGGRYQTNLYEISIIDSTGRNFKQQGTGNPNPSVDCGGCGSNQLDCGGCCADCAEIKNKLGAINVRLQ
jgi:hypothetical protein